jgi:hypothetical protein
MDLTQPFIITSRLASMEPMYDARCMFCKLPLNYNAQMGEIYTDHKRDCLWANAVEFAKWTRTLG